MIRKAVAPDLAAILDIENRAFSGNRLSRRSLRALISSPRALMLMSVNAGQIAGYAVLLYRKNSDKARLYSFAIHPDFKGQGLATQLMTAIESESLKRIIRLEVREDNAAAIQLYRKFKYEDVGRRANYYDDGQDACIMEKRLNS